MARWLNFWLDRGGVDGIEAFHTLACQSVVHVLSVECFYKHCEMLAWDAVHSADSVPFGSRHFVDDRADSWVVVGLYFKCVSAILGDVDHRFGLGTIDCVSSACQFFGDLLLGWQRKGPDLVLRAPKALLNGSEEVDQSAVPSCLHGDAIVQLTNDDCFLALHCDER